MKLKQIHEMGKEDLEKKLTELHLEKVKLMASVATGTAPKSPGQIKQTRKTIARIKTELSARKKEAKK